MSFTPSPEFRPEQPRKKRQAAYLFKGKLHEVKFPGWRSEPADWEVETDTVADLLEIGRKQVRRPGDLMEFTVGDARVVVYAFEQRKGQYHVDYFNDVRVYPAGQPKMPKDQVKKWIKALGSPTPRPEENAYYTRL